MTVAIHVPDRDDFAGEVAPTHDCLRPGCSEARLEQLGARRAGGSDGVGRRRERLIVRRIEGQGRIGAANGGPARQPVHHQKSIGRPRPSSFGRPSSTLRADPDRDRRSGDQCRPPSRCSGIADGPRRASAWRGAAGDGAEVRVRACTDESQRTAWPASCPGIRTALIGAMAGRRFHGQRPARIGW